MKSSAILNDDVLSGDEKIFNSSVHKYEVYNPFSEIQAELRGESFILIDNHLPESNAFDVLLRDEQHIRLIGIFLLLFK
jgi:hypothetical protein